MKNNYFKILILFLKEVILPSQIFTVISILCLIVYRTDYFGKIIFMKIIGSIFVVVMFHHYRRKFMYIFYNFGLSKTDVILICLLLDVMIYIPLFIITIKMTQ